MNRSSLPVALLVGVATYLVLELLAGSYGLLAFRDLERHAEAAAQAAEAIERRSVELTTMVRSLTSDPETILVEARDVGFAAADEVVVRVAGRTARTSHRYVPGQLPTPRPEPTDRRPLFRALALALGLVYLLVDLLAAQPTRGGTRRDESHRWTADVEGAANGRD